jgi:NAD(P)H dehydrogenase (quinone)
MNTLIVLAHPEPLSYNAHLARFARGRLAAGGHAVRTSDLYAMGFDPCEAGRHFSPRGQPDRFDAQVEQRFGWENGTLPAEVRGEIDKVLWADCVILQFPLWWFGVPAILKGWIDRVFAYGALYASTRRFDRGPCRGKRALLSVTAASVAEACAHDGFEGDTLLHLFPTMFALRYVGFAVIEPFVIYGVRAALRGAEAEARDRHLGAKEAEYAALLARIDKAPIVPFSADEDYENGRLKPGAPAYSPFIRHRKNLDFG